MIILTSPIKFAQLPDDLKRKPNRIDLVKTEDEDYDFDASEVHD